MATPAEHYDAGMAALGESARLNEMGGEDMLADATLKAQQAQAQFLGGILAAVIEEASHE